MIKCIHLAVDTYMLHLIAHTVMSIPVCILAICSFSLFQLFYTKQMINVFDPLFTIDTTKDAVSKGDLDDKITESVKEIAGAMGFKTVTPLGNDTASAPTTLAALDDLYLKDSVFVIPIIYETPVSSEIGNDYSASCYVSYLVITIKSGTVAKPDTSVTTAPFYSATANDGTMFGTGTTGAEAPSGLIVKLILLNEKALVDPNAFILSYVTR